MTKPLQLFILVAIFSLAACQEVQQSYVPVKHHKKIKKPVVIVAPSVVLPDSVCIAAVGDIMLGTSYPDKKTLPPDSGKNSFANVIEELHTADVVFGNLE